MRKNVWMWMLLASVVGWQSCSTDDGETSGGSSVQSWDGTVKSATYRSDLGEMQVQVTWDDSAQVVISSDLVGLVSAEIRGGAVTLLADESLADEVTYTLSGSSGRGSLYMDGSYKATFVLNGLTLVSPDSAAINIRDGKRINVELADGTVNTLSDASGGSHKACMMVKGHTEFSGGGSLTLMGKTGHAFWGKEYVQLKASVGTIKVTEAVGDGFNVNEFFQMNGGTLDVSGVGDDGIQVSFKTDDDEQVIPLTEDEDNTGLVLIQGGTLTVAATAEDSKGIKTEGDIIINENKGTTVVVVNNTGVSNGQSGGMGGGPGWGGNQSSASTTASKGVKAEGDITIESGAVQVYSASHEALEGKGIICVDGGMVYAEAADDGINSGSHLTISGGQVCAYSTGGDGIDANGNCYLKGGIIYAIGSGTAEVAVDANTESGYKLYVQGGTLVALGGIEQGATLSQACYQGSWSAGRWYALYSGSELAFAFKTPASGGSGMVVSTASTPTLQTGVSVSGGTDYFGGIGKVGCTVSGGSSVTLRAYSSSGQRW